MSDILPAVRDPQHGLGIVAPSQITLERFGVICHQSGMFKDLRSASQAVVKLAAGQELGIGAFAALQGLHVMDGKVTLGAGIIAAQIRKHPDYNFRVVKHDDTECVIEFIYKGDVVGVSPFTIADAKKAKLIKSDGGWEKFPRNMLYARAMSNGARWYCPDVFAGPIYTPDELGLEVNEQGDVVDPPIAKPREGELGVPQATASGGVSDDQRLVGGALREQLKELMGDEHLVFIRASATTIAGEGVGVDKLNGDQMDSLMKLMSAKIDELRGTGEGVADGDAAGVSAAAESPPATAVSEQAVVAGEGLPGDLPVKTLTYPSLSEAGVVRTVALYGDDEVVCDCPAHRYAQNRPCKHAKMAMGEWGLTVPDTEPVVEAEAVADDPKGDEIDRLGLLIRLGADNGLSGEESMRVVTTTTGGDIEKLLDATVYSQAQSAVFMAAKQAPVTEVVA